MSESNEKICEEYLGVCIYVGFLVFIRYDSEVPCPHTPFEQVKENDQNEPKASMSNFPYFQTKTV